MSSRASYVRNVLAQAVAVHQAGRLDEAEGLYKTILSTCPDHVDALSLLGTLYSQRARYEEGIELLNKAIIIDPSYAEAYYNRGRALQSINRHTDALRSYEKAVTIDPNYSEAYNNIGLAHYHFTRYEDALANFDKAIALNPDYADAYSNKSYVKLLLGEYEEGWKLYEWRWKKSDKGKARAFDQPLWLGKEPLKDKTILLHSEQGFGDVLQFCRYIPMVAAKAGKVIFECYETLAALMRYNFPHVEVIGIKPENEQRNNIQGYDCHTPLMSLPHAFSTTLATVPADFYLKAPPECIEKWDRILTEKIKKSQPAPPFRMGVCWAGGHRPEIPDSLDIDARRSLHFDQIKPLLDIKNAVFVSLQLGPPKLELDDERVLDISSQIMDWSDTAAIIALLDLVISVDTSVCHLSAAMGKKTFLLNRYDTCWRWLLNRNDSPWYSSLTQFRQKTPGDWSEVIGNVKNAVNKVGSVKL